MSSSARHLVTGGEKLVQVLDKNLSLECRDTNESL